MSFAHPWLLLLVPTLFGLAWLAFRRPGAAGDTAEPARVARRVVRGDGLAPDPRGPGARRGLWLAAGVALAALALARPQWGEIEERSFEQAREVLLALDLSRSMTADDVAPSRLARARLLVEALLEGLRGERVGLVVFAGSAFLQSPLSADYEVLRDLLPELEPELLPQGGTDYAAMLEVAGEAFSTEGESDRFLVVLSDGEAHDPGWRRALEPLRKRGVRVIGLGIGSAEGAVLRDPAGGVLKDARGAAVLTRLEAATLEELAARSGGLYRSAAVWVDIAALVEETVARGRAGHFVEKREQRRVERFQWLLAPALLCLLLATWLELPALPRPRSLRRPGLARAGAAAAAGAALAAVPWLAGSAPESAPRSALETLVDELARRPQPGAGDFARLAEETLTFIGGPEAPGAGASLPAERRRGVIDDGLAAVDAGRALDPGAADWEALRRRLQALRAQPPPPSQPQAQPPDDGAGDGEPSPGPDAMQPPADAADAADAGRGSPSETGERDEPNPTPPAGGGGTGEAPPEGDDAGDAPSPPGEPSHAAGGDEAGEPAGGEPGEMQRVGGGVADPAAGEHPELADALARMRRVREADSPARLFLRMQESEGRPRRERRGGKPW